MPFNKTENLTAPASPQRGYVLRRGGRPGWESLYRVLFVVICMMETMTRFFPTFRIGRWHSETAHCHSTLPQDSNVGAAGGGGCLLSLPPRQVEAPIPTWPGLTLAWSFVMSGLRSERLKSWKEEKEGIMRRLACGSHPRWELCPHVSNRAPHQTPVPTNGGSPAGSQDKGGGEREVCTLSHSPQ